MMTDAGPIDEDTLEKSTDPQVNRINLSRTGCNKHFKTSLLARGFHAGPCDDQLQGNGNEDVTDICLKKGTPKTEAQMEVYNRDYDALYYACEATIGRYGDDIAEYLANHNHHHQHQQQQRTGHVELGHTIRAVCRDVGKCNMHRRRPRKQPRDMSAMTETSHEDLLPSLVALMAANDAKPPYVKARVDINAGSIVRLLPPAPAAASPGSTQSNTCSQSVSSSSLGDNVIPSTEHPQLSLITEPDDASKGAPQSRPTTPPSTRPTTGAIVPLSIQNEMVRGIQLWSTNKIELFSQFPGSSGSYMYRRRGTGNTSKATDKESTLPDAISQQQPAIADSGDTADSAVYGITVPMDRRDWVVRYNEGLLRSERSTKAAALQRQLDVQDLRYERFLTSLEDDTIDAQTSLDGTLRPQLPPRQKRVRSCRTRKEAATLSHKTPRRC
ncbi:hypothetical protein FOZ62_018949 [Perkinsus olseni]|uniref:Uncharacterized protein n=1 Tax=Perkinsus olseni TaxID=32597 RepID=A0A7J6TK76_PEROL|nr:hypothetical protein FOZ62_018949 [Perkinsus olseni]